MKLSTKGRYGLRAMIDLAVYSEKEPVSIQSIADRQNISERYLEQLMASLKKEGLVKSIRGANGGYQLARPAIGISVGDILRALEGEQVLLTSRLGAFKLIPVSAEEKIVSNIAEGLQEVKLIEAGKLPAKNAKSFLDEL